MNTSRSNAQSEPEPVSVVNTYGSPVSAREDVVFFTEKAEGPSEEVAAAVGKLIEVTFSHPVDENLDWIIRDCLITLHEHGWGCSLLERGEEKDVVLVNLSSGEKRSDHEILLAYRELVRRIRFESSKLANLRRDSSYQIREIILDRLRKVRDPRYVSRPSTIEGILKLLRIDIVCETFLVQIVKEEVDASFFQMIQAEGPEYVTVDTCFSVEQLMTRIALERMRNFKRISPSGLLFCVECKYRLADGSCAECGDCLCASCHSRLHAKGNRRNHLFVLLEQVVCANCAVKSADIRCNDCGDLFCRSCFTSTHDKGKHLKHCVQLAVPVFCLNCELEEARIICLECFDALCLKCSNRIHRSGMRQEHALFGIQRIAYPKKLFASNIGDIVKILDRILTTPSRGNWYLFFDENSGPFWYNFVTRKTVPTTIEDMNLRPEESPEEQGAFEQARIAKAKQHACFETPSDFSYKLSMC
jgi:hypothetical protein